jgi:hypothetical protein
MASPWTTVKLLAQLLLSILLTCAALLAASCVFWG